MKKVASKWVDLAVVLKPPAGYHAALKKRIKPVVLSRKQRGHA